MVSIRKSKESSGTDRRTLQIHQVIADLVEYANEIHERDIISVNFVIIVEKREKRGDGHIHIDHGTRHHQLDGNAKQASSFCEMRDDPWC